MLFIAFKRLWNRIGLTLLSILGVTLAIGLAVSIPVFAKAVSFVMLREELKLLSAADDRPPFSARFYVLPSGQYPLPLDHAAAIGTFVAETIASSTGLPLISQDRQMETMGMLVRTGDFESDHGPPHTTVLQDARIRILPGVELKMTIVDGEPMGAGTSQGDVLDIWLHYATVTDAALIPGEKYELYDARNRTSIPIRIAGTWIPTSPLDPFWLEDPDRTLQRALLVREGDYQALVEPLFEQQLRSASWHVVLDHRQLTSENMKAYADGLRAGIVNVAQSLPEPRIESPLLKALDTALQRESDLTMLMFVFSVPVMGFLLYFLSLISTVTVRWQRRETAMMVSRGLDSGQLLTISIIEACAIVGLGLPLGILVGVQLARALGYAESFVQFTRRPPLPTSPSAISVPLVAAAVSASLLARLWPVLGRRRTSIVSYEHRRARAPHRPLWQRLYIDFLLLIPVYYAYRRLSAHGTLVPRTIAGGETTTQDPLLYLVPILFMFALSLLLVRLFPILMRFADWLFALGRRTALYLAFRQLARQSAQYTSALFLVIAAISLGVFMASMAASLGDWLADQVYYAVGADVFIKQMINPAFLAAGMIPSDGAWMLPIQSYLDLPGVTHAARVGLYRATYQPESHRSLPATFMGIDRVDVPGVVFFRSDFASDPLGGLMNRLALREDAVLVSERVMAEGRFEVGDKLPVLVTVMDLFDHKVTLDTEFTIAGTYKYFPKVYEGGEDGQTAIIGNLDYLFERIGGPELHDIWLKTQSDADKHELVARVESMNVHIQDWAEAREEISKERAKAESVGIFGTLTIGFLAAAIFSGIGLLIHNYASLQERLFRFTILRAVGLSLAQVVSQVTVEYVVLVTYGVAGGVAIGAWASVLFIPFFQAADENVLKPPTLVPVVAWEEILLIAAAFVVVLVLAQVVVIALALRKGVFQALRIGDQE